MINECQYFREIKYSKYDLHISERALNEDVRSIAWNNTPVWK